MINMVNRILLSTNIHKLTIRCVWVARYSLFFFSPFLFSLFCFLALGSSPCSSPSCSIAKVASCFAGSQAANKKPNSCAHTSRTLVKGCKQWASTCNHMLCSCSTYCGLRMMGQWSKMSRSSLRTDLRRRSIVFSSSLLADWNMQWKSCR